MAFLDWSTTASSNTTVGGIGIQGTNAVSNFDDALRTVMAEARAGIDGKSLYIPKSSTYTAVAADNNGIIVFSAAATLNLTAAATLAANWHVLVVAGGGDVVIDPAGGETINGGTTFTLPRGSSAYVICTGLNFATAFGGSITSSAGFTYVLRDGVGNVNARDLTADRGDHTGVINMGAAADGVRWERTAGGVNLVGASLATTIFTQPPTDNSTNPASTAYVNSRYAESSNLTPTLGGVVSFTHGLGAAPKMFGAILINTTTEFSYAVGSKINARSDNIGTAAGHGIEVIPNATTIDARVGNTSIGKALDAGSGAAVTLTTANWRVILWAHL